MTRFFCLMLVATFASLECHLAGGISGPKPDEKVPPKNVTNSLGMLF